MTISRTAPFGFTLRQLQYVVAVSETLSFSRAAERCHVSQPALSAQLAEVENQLGVVLFERARKQVLVTPAGASLLPLIRRALIAADELEQTAELAREPFGGTLRLGVIPTISPYLLPRIVPALSAAKPKLRLVWTEDKTEDLMTALNEGRLEAAIVALEAPIGDVEHAVIGHDPFVLAMPKQHRLAKGRTRVRREELRDESILLLDDGHCVRDQALSFCSQAGPTELGFRATSLSTLAQMVGSGTGITLLPELSVNTENRDGQLAVRRFADPEPSRTIALVWRKQSPLGPSFHALADIMKKAARAH